MKKLKQQDGFNLVELMVVVAIVGIIATFAYPSYLEQINGSRRADCSGALVSLGSAMERHYSVNGSYLNAAAAGADTGAPAIYSATCPVDGGDATYNITIQAAAASTYTLLAVPAGPQIGDKCGNLTLTNTGVKGVASAQAGITWQQCW